MRGQHVAESLSLQEGVKSHALDKLVYSGKKKSCLRQADLFHFDEFYFINIVEFPLALNSQRKRVAAVGNMTTTV